MTTVLAIVTMLVSYAAIRAGLKPARIVLFIFKESYVVLLIEQIWSYIDSTLDPKAAKRLNGPICGVAGIGAVAAGWSRPMVAAARNVFERCSVRRRGDDPDGAFLCKCSSPALVPPAKAKRNTAATWHCIYSDASECCCC